MNASNDTQRICSVQLSNFHLVFGQIYPYAALVICVVSVASNFSNIIILGQRKMGSSTNTILLAIATSDMLVCVSQIPLIISQNNPFNLNYYVWAITYLCTTNCALLAHTASLWLGVVLAMFRLIYIKLYPSAAAKVFFGIERAKLSIILTYLLWLVLLMPYLSTMRIHVRSVNNVTYFIPTRSTSNANMELYSFWNMAILGKILPCTLTIVFGCCLLSTLRFARHRHDLLVRARGEHSRPRLSRRTQDHRRTTRLLVSIILLVLPTELPIASLMLATRLNEHIKCVYLHLGDLLDFLSLLKNFITFVLYCSMSNEYRNEFRRNFLSFLKCKGSPVVSNSTPRQMEQSSRPDSITNSTNLASKHYALVNVMADASMKHLLCSHDIERSSFCMENR